MRAGQWWRIITPVLVQPDGWGQLVFNLLGLTIVGAALERRTSRPAWTLTYLLGGVGGIAGVSAWHPGDLGGGSSDAVAALIGALTVLLAAESHDHSDHDHSDHDHSDHSDHSDHDDADHYGHHDRPGRRLWAGWPAQLYCAFFAAYLTALDLGGLRWSVLAGNATIVAFFVARRALSPTRLTQACLLLVDAAGVTMAAAQDGHGLGILTGAGIASLALLRRRTLSARSSNRC